MLSKVQGLGEDTNGRAREALHDDTEGSGVRCSSRDAAARASSSAAGARARAAVRAQQRTLLAPEKSRRRRT